MKTISVASLSLSAFSCRQVYANAFLQERQRLSNETPSFWDPGFQEAKVKNQRVRGVRDMCAIVVITLPRHINANVCVRVRVRVRVRLRLRVRVRDRVHVRVRVCVQT